MSRLLIVSELFYPDGTSTAHILTKIVDHLCKEHDIIVLAGPKSYSSDNVSGISDSEKSYPIKRVNIGEYDKNRLLSRTLKFLVTSLKLGWLLWKNGKKDDDVLIVTNPAPFIVMASIIKRLRGFKLNILVHDVFPENAAAAGVLNSTNSLVYKFIKYIFSTAYKSADNIIVLGRDMKEVFVEKFKSNKKKTTIRIIENWADPLPRNYKSSKRTIGALIKVLYAGNIGRCQGLEQFIKIFEKASNVDLKFIMRGGGAIVPDIITYIERTKSNIALGSPYSREEQFDILSECDIALVTLADGMYGLGVPSKSYNIMAAGKPILFIGDLRSEIAQVVQEYGIGYCFDPKDEKGLLVWLNSITLEYREEFMKMGEKARQLAETIYSEDTILSKYSRLFSNQ